MILKTLTAWSMHLLNPHRLKTLFQRFGRLMFTTGLFILIFSYIWVFFFLPSDAVQGEMIKLMYIHVPSAWLSMMCYGSLALFSLIFLTIKAPMGYHFAYAFGKIGITFTAICLITGSLWGMPMWGTWWVWDARLTSVLILFFMYLAYLVLNQAFQNQERLKKITSIYALIGIVNLPIIKWSVNWWNTLHQPATLTKLSTPSIHVSLMIPLLMCFVGWFLLTMWYVFADAVLQQNKRAS